MDPTRALSVTVRTDSPHVVSFRLWYQRPGDAAWTIFATAGPDSPNPATFEVGPLPAGSKLQYLVIVGGNPQTAYRVVLTALQGDDALGGTPLTLTGTTGQAGTATESGEVDP